MLVPKYVRPCKQFAVVNIRRVPCAVRDRFKAYCAARGYTMQDAIIALMKKASSEDKPLPDARKQIGG